jgi:hypothetical protein
MPAESTARSGYQATGPLALGLKEVYALAPTLNNRPLARVRTPWWRRVAVGAKPENPIQRLDRTDLALPPNVLATRLAGLSKLCFIHSI